METPRGLIVTTSDGRGGLSRGVKERVKLNE
jgi:hypothetical protein